MDELDLNLLRVLVALGDRRSVSAAARQLDRSQPSVSAALSRLRQHFADPLLFRSGNSMQTTPRAEVLIDSARSVLLRVNVELASTPTFIPAAATQPFRMALSDVGEVVFLPRLLTALRRLAPNAPVRSVSVPPQQLAEELEKGSIDLAIGYFPDLKRSNFFQQGLFKDTFASLVRVGHPALSHKLNIKQYLQMEHAVVRAESRTEEVIERFLLKKRLHRNVVLTTPHFTSAPIVVAQSDLIVTLPEPLARYFSTVSAQLRVIELPFRAPQIELKQFWHRRFHHDDRNRWLRKLVSSAFQKRRLP